MEAEKIRSLTGRAARLDWTITSCSVTVQCKLQDSGSGSVLWDNKMQHVCNGSMQSYLYKSEQSSCSPLGKTKQKYILHCDVRRAPSRETEPPPYRIHFKIPTQRCAQLCYAIGIFFLHAYRSILHLHFLTGLRSSISAASLPQGWVIISDISSNLRFLRLNFS